MTDSKPSKSALKREQLALQALGEKLIELDEQTLESMSLDEALLSAVLLARRIRSHGALRRQKQLIGKLMRNTDPEPIRLALEESGREEAAAKRLFATAERWRDRVLREGIPAVTDFGEQCGADQASLRNLVIELEASFSDAEETRIRREIFRSIHNTLAGTGQDG